MQIYSLSESMPVLFVCQATEGSVEALAFAGPVPKQPTPSDSEGNSNSSSEESDSEQQTNKKKQNKKKRRNSFKGKYPPCEDTRYGHH